MKKVAKNIFLSVASIFLVCSMVFTLFQMGITNENLESIEQIKTQSITTTTIPNTQSMQSYHYGASSILSEYIFLFVISLILGGLIGLILSLKENSKVKYVLFFIIGDMIYTGIWMGIQQIAYKAYNVKEIYTLSSYVEAFQRYFLSYVFIFAIIVVAVILYNKYKVKQLNETLMQNREVNLKEKKPIFTPKRKTIMIRTGILILLIAMIIGVSIIGKRAIVLIEYDKVASKQYDNYHVIVDLKFESENGEIQINRQDIYYKDGILKQVGDDGNIYYVDFEANKYIYIQTGTKMASIQEIGDYFSKQMIDNFFYATNAERIWSNIELAFQVSVSTETVSGIECDVIQRDNVKIYLDKENHMPIQRVVYTNFIVDGEEGVNISTDSYQYEIGTVTDEEVKEVDLTGYKIEDRRMEN